MMYKKQTMKIRGITNKSAANGSSIVSNMVENSSSFSCINMRAHLQEVIQKWK